MGVQMEAELCQDGKNDEICNEFKMITLNKYIYIKPIAQK